MQHFIEEKTGPLHPLFPGIMSRVTFDKVQANFCFPVIDELWKDTLKATWEKLRAKGNIVLAGIVHHKKIFPSSCTNFN